MTGDNKHGEFISARREERRLSIRDGRYYFPPSLGKSGRIFIRPYDRDPRSQLQLKSSLTREREREGDRTKPLSRIRALRIPFICWQHRQPPLITGRFYCEQPTNAVAFHDFFHASPREKRGDENAAVPRFAIPVFTAQPPTEAVSSRSIAVDRCSSAVNRKLIRISSMTLWFCTTAFRRLTRAYLCATHGCSCRRLYPNGSRFESGSFMKT